MLHVRKFPALRSAALTAGWGLLVFYALDTARTAVAGLALDPALVNEPFRENYRTIRPLVIMHGASAVIALIIGPVQLHPAFRNWAASHRVLGRIYLTSVVFAGLSGFWMGTRAFGGNTTRLVFCLLSVFWLYTAAMLLRAALARDFARHRRWAIRCYALTSGAVALRVLLHALESYGFFFENVYPTAVAASWAVPLLIVEAVLFYQVKGVSRERSPV